MDRRNSAPYRFSSSSSLKLLVFMVPLIVVSGFAFFLGPKTSNWLWKPPLPSSTSLTDTTNTSAAATVRPFSSTEDNEGHLDLRSMVVDVHHQVEEAHTDDSVLNRSSSPPLSKEAVQLIPTPDWEREDGVNRTVNISQVISSSNESEAVVTAAKIRRGYSRLERLEANLRRVRATIREARNGNQTQDSDYVPTGPMYWNAKSFHRSYLEMEKHFKVFVYGEGEPPLFHNGPCKSIYSMEGNFIHMMEINNQFRTRDPEKAHVFFLPFSVTMLVRFVYARDSKDFTPIRKTVVDYIDTISEKYPFWNRSLGADHFMLACHDWGPETSFSVPYLYKHSIRVLCNANTSEGFNPSKDVSFPEVNLQTGYINGFVGGPSPSRRSILAFFAGGVHGPIRPVLLEHWENKDEEMKVHQYLPGGVSYYDMLRNSKFCICPSGYEVASPRIVEALYTGCVPVLISDHYVPPFSDVLNWKSFSVEVSVEDIPNLKTILTSISRRQYIRMQRRGVQVRRHFEVNNPPKRYDVFNMILHSVWLRRLNVRVREE